MMDSDTQHILKHFMIYYLFSSSSILFTKCKREFFSFFRSGDRSGLGSGVDPVDRVLPRFFIGNDLPLKLLRTFSLALRNNPNLFKNTFLQLEF